MFCSVPTCLHWGLYGNNGGFDFRFSCPCKIPTFHGQITMKFSNHIHNPQWVKSFHEVSFSSTGKNVEVVELVSILSFNLDIFCSSGISFPGRQILTLWVGIWTRPDAFVLMMSEQSFRWSSIVFFQFKTHACIQISYYISECPHLPNKWCSERFSWDRFQLSGNSLLNKHVWLLPDSWTGLSKINNLTQDRRWLTLNTLKRVKQSIFFHQNIRAVLAQSRAFVTFCGWKEK